jgi:hypothetical protein
VLRELILEAGEEYAAEQLIKHHKPMADKLVLEEIALSLVELVNTEV